MYSLPLCASEFMPAVPPSTMSPRGADQSVDRSSTSWTDQYFHLRRRWQKSRAQLLTFTLSGSKMNIKSKNANMQTWPLGPKWPASIRFFAFKSTNCCDTNREGTREQQFVSTQGATLIRSVLFTAPTMRELVSGSNVATYGHDQRTHLKLYPKIALATYLPLKSSVSSPPSTLACFPKLLPSTPPGPPPLHSSSSK